MWNAVSQMFEEVVNMHEVLNIPGFWISQGSEYTRVWIYQGSEYARVLNIIGFWIFQGSEYARVLNRPGFWIYQGFEYTGVTQTSDCAWISLDKSWICLIMSEYARMLNTNLTLLLPVSLTLEFTIFENGAKKNLHYFRKTLYRRCLEKLWICLRSWICQGSEYTRALNISEFLVCQVLNMPGFWIYRSYTDFWLCLNIPG